jgi:hypothetical protein
MTLYTSVEDADFIFENKPVRVTANRDEPKIKLAGITVGPFEEGKEYEIRHWIAEELKAAGVIRFREEDLLNVVKLHKMNWKERVQPTNRLSSLPVNFYPQLRRCLVDLEKTSKSDSKRLREYEKSIRISHDIVNSRLKKIVSLASSPPVTAQALQCLTPEEKILYHRLHNIIGEFRSGILEGGGISNRRD